VTIKPLPAPLPKDRTVEGGIQARVSAAGFTKLENSIPDLVRNGFANGICIGDQRFGTIGGFSSIEACDTNACANNQQGCPAHVNVDSINFGVPDGGPMTLDLVFDITQLPMHISWLGGITSCTMDITTTSSAHVVAQVNFGVDTQTGNLSIHLAPNGIQMVNLPLNFSGCSILGPILSTLEPLINTSVGQAIITFLSPVIDNIIQSFLPNPLGIEGLIDTSSLLRTAKLVTQDPAALEVKVIPGGYVDLHGGGLSLGIISGLNSDSDTSTRNAGTSGPGTYHEHARCAPDLPLMLPALPRQTDRGTFSLLPVPAFAGIPEAPADFGIGVSRTFLNMAGFDVVNSGTLCLDVGAAQLGLPFNVGTVGIIIPSLGNLTDDAKAPMLIVLRPQQAVTFDVGTGARDSAGNVTDPALHVGVKEMKADMYAFIDDRYVRAFTLTIDLQVGVDLSFTTDANGAPAVEPLLVGVNSQNLQISVENTTLLAESTDRLQMVFPMLTQLLVPVLSGQLKPITLPQIGGFTLGSLHMTRVDSGQERFLAVYASLDHVGPTPPAPRVTTTASIDNVVMPSVADMRYGAKRPQVTLALGANVNEPLEFSWRIDGGMWRSWSRDAHPTLSPDEFLLQGRHSVDVRSRPVDDWQRADRDFVHLDVLLDSAPPWLDVSTDGDTLVLAAGDLVSTNLRYEIAEAGTSNWRIVEPRLAKAALPNTFDVRITDEAGNFLVRQFDVSVLWHGRETTASSGCNCSVSGRDDGGALLLGLIVIGVVLLARRRRLAIVLAALLGGCGDDISSQPCHSDLDCTSLPCSSGGIPLCGDNNECTCAMEIPLGHVGRFSSMTLTGDQATISAYNDTYGDLMVGHIVPPGIVADWQFVDGVPDGPVVLPQSNVRGGIRAAGDDVGKYTSIVTGPDGQPRVAYFDATYGRLKYAVWDGAAWKIQIVDAPAAGAMDEIGWWASLALRADGTPGIAYYVDRPQADGSHLTELRFAQAMTPMPAMQSDWVTTAVTGGMIAAPPMGMTPSSEDWPAATGLFPALAHLSSGKPVIAFYDHVKGNLMLATGSTAAGGTFMLKVLDGQDASGTDTGDVGLFPSITVDAADSVHVSYQGNAPGGLRYYNTHDARIEIVDDGYRIDGQNAEGLDQPVLHFVGADSALVLQGAVRMVVYQDATSHELLAATRKTDGTWMRDSIAGSNPDDGAFGFFAQAQPTMSGNAVISSYVVNQRLRPPKFYVQLFTRPLVVP
jgi:MYXO-CTERM domain-containing protein